MAAKILPPAMAMLPRTAGQAKLGFPMASTKLNWNQSSVSTVRLASKRVSLKPVVAFRARAEAGEGGGVSETATDEEDVVSEVSGEREELESEVQAVRTPRVKLGDVMGEVPENRRRLSIYKGIVISRQNAGIHNYSDSEDHCWCRS